MKWNVDSEGNVILCPLLGWGTATPAMAACALNLEYAERPEDIGTEGKSVQLVMSPPQAVELAQALLNAAQIASESRPAGNA